MRRLFQGIAILGFLLPGSAAPPHSEITVRLQNYARASRATLRPARELATDVFRSAGVDLVWLDCAPTDRDRSRDQACANPIGPRDLFLRVMPEAPAMRAKQGDVFGIAYLSDKGGFSRIASVYLDQVTRLASQRHQSVGTGTLAAHLPPSTCVALAMGTVMAHELGHLLLGLNGHSSKGIMRPNLGWRDFEQAHCGELKFTHDQAKRLLKNVGARGRAAGKNS